MPLRRLIHGLFLLTFIVSFIQSTPTARADAQFQTSQVQAVLASMTPEERVGQLFLVTFQGTDTDPDSQIYDLIVNHHVGGVVLVVENDNFIAAPDTVSGVYQLIDTLQMIESDATTQNLSGQAPRNIYVPLFIGLSQEGDGSPHDQILSGLTPLPDAMAISASSPHRRWPGICPTVPLGLDRCDSGSGR